jgi:hypothetical protein
MGIRIRRGVIGLGTLLGAVLQSGTAAATNGDNLIEYQRTPGGVVENYYAAGDDNLVFGLIAADAAFRGFFLNLETPDPSIARDGLDDFVPIELKRWNNNAAKEMMRRIIAGYFDEQSGTTHLVPTRRNETTDKDPVSGQAVAGTTNLRHPYYVGKMMEWADDPSTRAKAQALANATTQYFTPISGSGFLNNVNVETGNAEPRTPILAVNWGMALGGMGMLAKQFGNTAYWSWAGPRLQFVADHRRRTPGNDTWTFADIYDSEGWTNRAEASAADIAETRDMSDTDTLYLLRFAYEGARLASDHAIMSILENVGNQWFTGGWMTFQVEGENFSHNTRKLSRENGSFVMDSIYGDGKWNYVYALSALYRMTGNQQIISRIEQLWGTYLYVALDGLLVAGVRNGNDSFEVNGNPISENQALMLDALIDAHLATGSTVLLAYAQGLADAIRSRPPGEQESPREFTGRPFLRVAEATQGGIGRLEVNLGVAGGLVTVKTAAGFPVVPTRTLPNQSAVFYLPQGTYRVELGRVGSATRSVTLAVTPAGVKIDYLDGSPSTSFLTGVIAQDNNDNGIQDAGDTTPSGARLYVDANNNGSYNAGEINQVVGTTGSYALSVPIGARTLRAALPAGTTSRWTAPLTGVVNGAPSHAFTFHSPGLTVTPAAFAWTTKKRISGNVFLDVNANAVKNSAEPYLTESIVYVDTNNNGVRNLGEPFAATNTSGAYSIGNLVGGGVLRLVTRSAIPLVTLPTGGSQSVGLATPGQHATGRNFGCR